VPARVFVREKSMPRMGCARNARTTRQFSKYFQKKAIHRFTTAISPLAPGARKKKLGKVRAVRAMAICF
jgi:hypothetical protein